MVIQLGKWFLTMFNFKGTLNSQKAEPSLGLIQQVILSVLFRVCLYKSLMKSPTTVAFWRAHCSVGLFTLFSLCSCHVPWHQEPSEPDRNSRFFHRHLPACRVSQDHITALPFKPGRTFAQRWWKSTPPYLGFSWLQLPPREKKESDSRPGLMETQGRLSYWVRGLSEELLIPLTGRQAASWGLWREFRLCQREQGIPSCRSQVKREILCHRVGKKSIVQAWRQTVWFLGSNWRGPWISGKT